MTEDQIIYLFSTGEVQFALEMTEMHGFSNLKETFQKALKHTSNIALYRDHYRKNNGRIPGAQIEQGKGPDIRQQTALKHLFAIKADSLLDIGCADGSFDFFCFENKIVKQVTGIDPWEEGIQWAMKYSREHSLNAFFIQGLFEDISLEKFTFDAIHLGETLEHVIDPIKILRSLRKYSIKGIVITVPLKRPTITAEEKKILTSGQTAEHVRLINLASLQEYCKESGFKIINIDVTGIGWVNLIATLI